MSTIKQRGFVFRCALAFLCTLSVACMPVSSQAFASEPHEVKLHLRGDPLLYPAPDDGSKEWKEFDTITTTQGTTFGEIKSKLPQPLDFEGYAFEAYTKNHGSYPWKDADTFTKSDHNVDYAYQMRFMQKYNLGEATNAEDAAFALYTQRDYLGTGVQPSVTPEKKYSEDQRDNAQFMGWFEDAQGTKQYDFKKKLLNYWEEQGKKYQEKWANKHVPSQPYKVFEPITAFALFNESPLLSVTNATINAGENFDPLSLVVSAVDKEDGNLKDLNKVTYSGSYDLTKEGKYLIEYTATDSSGLKHKAVATLTVKGSVPTEPATLDPHPVAPVNPEVTPSNPASGLTIKPYDPSLYPGSIQSSGDTGYDHGLDGKAQRSKSSSGLPQTADETGATQLMGFMAVAGCALLSAAFKLIRKQEYEDK